jgi:hypothetical protein
LEQLEARLAERQSALEAFFVSEEERFRAVHEDRRARIHRAHTSCIKQVLAKARQAKEREIGDLQVRHLQAQRSLPVKLKAVDQEYADFVAELAGQRANLSSLGQKAQKVFAGSRCVPSDA